MEWANSNFSYSEVNKVREECQQSIIVNEGIENVVEIFNVADVRCKTNCLIIPNFLFFDRVLYCLLSART